MITFDAQNQILGRLAVKIANTLRGKDKPSFAPHKLSGEPVTVINVEKIKVTGNKLKNKLYYRHSGYLGHLRSTPLGELMVKKPEWVLRRAVSGMLPKNRLRRRWLKQLIIKKGTNG